jgi:hypothetical protein
MFTNILFVVRTVLYTKARGGSLGIFMLTLHATLLHMPPLRFDFFGAYYKIEPRNLVTLALVL